MFSSESNRKAAKSMEQLTSLLENVLQADPGLSLRMASRNQHEDQSDGASIRTTRTTSTMLNWRAIMRPFEKTLFKTRVYSRAILKTETSTFRTLETAGTTWSQLSGLSLSQISSVAVILLPIAISDVYNNKSYDFSATAAPRAVTSPSIIPPGVAMGYRDAPAHYSDVHPVLGVEFHGTNGDPNIWERERLSPRPFSPPRPAVWCQCDFHKKFKALQNDEHPFAEYSCQLLTEFGDIGGTLSLTTSAVCYNSPYATSGVLCTRLSALVRIERESVDAEDEMLTIACSERTIAFKIAQPNDAYDKIVAKLKTQYEMQELVGTDGYYIRRKKPSGKYVARRGPDGRVLYFPQDEP
jgi:hypothetical protein